MQYYICEKLSSPLIKSNYRVITETEISSIDEAKEIVWNDTPFPTKQDAIEYIDCIETNDIRPIESELQYYGDSSAYDDNPTPEDLREYGCISNYDN